MIDTANYKMVNLSPNGKTQFNALMPMRRHLGIIAIMVDFDV